MPAQRGSVAHSRCNAAACRSACRAAPCPLLLVMLLVLPFCVPSRRGSLIVASCQLFRPRVLPPACGSENEITRAKAMNFARFSYNLKKCLISIVKNEHLCLMTRVLILLYSVSDSAMRAAPGG